MIYGTQEFAELLKEIIRDGKRHRLYEQSCKHAEEMSVHINGDKPYYLLEMNRPREDGEIKAYRIDNFEPTTKAGADKAIEIVCKGFNPTLYSIVWKDQTPEGEELEDYTLQNYPATNSIVNFNKDVLLPKMLADPNGLVAVKPLNTPYLGEDDTQKPEPIIVIYGSKAIFWFDVDCYLICVYEPSPSEKKDENRVYEFEYFDKNLYVQFDAWYDGSNKEIIIDNEREYSHKIGKIPAWPLGGKSRNNDNGTVLFQSFFSSALPYWNLAVKHGSDLMASIIGHLFPQKYEVAEECAYKHEYEGISYSCRGGKVKYKTGSGKTDFSEIDCPQCRGTGLVSVRGPLQTYQFLKEKLSVEGTGLSIPPVGYIDVPIDATKFLDEYTEKMIQRAMWAINMDIEEKVGENQSGVAKTIDRSAQNDTIYGIHSRIWDVHTNNEYEFINAYKYGPAAESTGKDKDKNLPDVHKPVKFDLLTTSEQIFNFKVSKDSGLDRNLLRSQAINIVKSENGATPDMKNYQIALIELDPLYGMTPDDIDLSVSKGVARKVDWAIHDNIKMFIDRAIEEDKGFLTKTMKEKLTVLENFGNELIKAEKPRVDESMIMKVNDDDPFKQDEAA